MTTTVHEKIENEIDHSQKSDWQLYRRTDGRLVFKPSNQNGDAKETPIQVACCFPWSHPQQFVSLRDDNGRELMLLESLDGLEKDQRELIEEEIVQRNFIPRVTKIREITYKTQFFHWEVETTAGVRSFLTRKHERPRQLASGESLIKDIYRDVYIIPKAEDMDAKSLRLIWVYLD